jgi:hypothetical protein
MLPPCFPPKHFWNECWRSFHPSLCSVFKHGWKNCIISGKFNKGFSEKYHNSHSFVMHWVKLRDTLVANWHHEKHNHVGICACGSHWTCVSPDPQQLLSSIVYDMIPEMLKCEYNERISVDIITVLIVCKNMFPEHTQHLHCMLPKRLYYPGSFSGWKVFLNFIHFCLITGSN